MRAAIIFGTLLCASGLQGAGFEPGVTQSQQPIEQALRENSEAIMALPNVVATGIGLCGDELCIKVMVTTESPGLREKLAEFLGEHPFEIELTDPVKAL